MFYGLFETDPNTEAYIAALTGLLQVPVRPDLKKIITEENDAAVSFELQTKAPVAATTLVAEWRHVENCRIVRVASAFDGRPIETMFSGRKPDRPEGAPASAPEASQAPAGTTASCTSTAASSAIG